MVNIVKGSNAVVNLLMSSRIHYVSPAANLASKERFPEVTKTNGVRKEKSDIVLTLQESTFTPRRFKGVNPRNLPKLEMFDSLGQPSPVPYVCIRMEGHVAKRVLGS